MIKVLHILVFCISLILGTLFSCGDDCPELKRKERGVYQIIGGDGPIPMSNGIVDIREKEVEIVYPDDAAVEWHVLYKITKEE